ncbi:hypothetical protein BT63DRAFT_459934 [Microthyrium microscopicum]|uniref:Uncharacterized protein n=1 Tax=Microthyrium microscopicum TaxID=703497 RepID=A0A6A6TYE2_9PEZI|nr:hypothetical protein BT63DRAFT_459934 [Microthyrium microscopicum]
MSFSRPTITIQLPWRSSIREMTLPQLTQWLVLQSFTAFLLLIGTAQVLCVTFRRLITRSFYLHSTRIQGNRILIIPIIFPILALGTYYTRYHDWFFFHVTGEVPDEERRIWSVSMFLLYILTLCIYWVFSVVWAAVAVGCLYGWSLCVSWLYVRLMDWTEGDWGFVPEKMEFPYETMWEW